MKFHAAWDSIEKENRNLKILVIALCCLSIFLTITVTSIATKEPVIIERACYSQRLVGAGDPNPSELEIKVFVEKAISARFNTAAENLDLLSYRQRSFREKEQSELSKQKMNQRVVTNEVTITKDAITVNADRLISVQNLRSALRFPLKISLERTDRTESNPYGLLLSDVDPIEEAKTK